MDDPKQRRPDITLRDEKTPPTDRRGKVCAVVWPQAPAVTCGCNSVRASGLICLHLGTDLLAQYVDGHHLAIAFEVPVGPAVAGGRPFQMGADLMDRALHVIADQRAVGADLGLESVAEGEEFFPRSTTWPKGTRGSARFDPVISSASLSNLRIRSMRFAAAAR